MKHVFDIAYKTGLAINGDADVVAFCTDTFNQSVSVFMDWLGTAEFEDEEEDIFPYVIVRGNTESGGDGVDDEFDVNVLVAIDASVDGQDNSKAVKDENGIYCAGRSDKLSDLCEKIIEAVKGYKCGAILKTYDVDYDNATSYPIQFALIGLNFESVNSY